MFTKYSTIQEVLNTMPNSRLLFPVDRSIPLDMTLEELSTSNVYIWYSFIDPNKTVEIINTLYLSKHQYFYNIYSEQEREKDPTKQDTGLYFFKGKLNKPYAICNAGGGFMYVGALHDSFPHALEINKHGYNSFVLIYRVDHPFEDLYNAIKYIYDYYDLLGVDRNHYSLWGGSAGARMAASLGNKQTLDNLGGHLPQCDAVIMQYTGYNRVSKYDVPTYVCVGTSDGIADYKRMKHRLDRLNNLGIDTEYHAYQGLPHGFGLGTNTIAQGWIEDAINFWESHM